MRIEGNLRISEDDQIEHPPEFSGKHARVTLTKNPAYARIFCYTDTV